jgi:hypothetical protein
MRNSALRLALLVLALSIAAPARAQTVDATLTTLIAGRQDPRDGKVYTVVPLYELVSLSLGDVHYRFVDDLRIIVSGWGELAFGDPREGTFAGDLDIGFLQASLLKGRITLRAGRQFVFGGAARATQIDGVSVDARLWRGLHVMAYGGAPVTPRFATSRGDAIAGTRAYFRLSPDAEFGASFVHVMDQGRIARQDLGFDARLRLLRALTVSGYALLSTVELRLAEGDLAVAWQPRPTFDATVEYRRTAPDLFIPRSSIFAVFSMETRDEAGATLYFRPVPRVRLAADYHAVVDAAGVGHRGGGKATIALGPTFETSLGAELRELHRPGTGGYTEARLFASHRPVPPVAITIDLDAFRLEQLVNGQSFSFTGAATVGWDFARSWRAVVSAVGDVTPQVERRFEFMAKVVWNHSFHVREVHP